jgi:hypothetical protein
VTAVERLTEVALGMFPEPEPPEPEVPAQTWGAVDVKWSGYRGARTPCHDCVRLIHERGVANVPPASPAAHRRKGPNGDELLCGSHAQARRSLDARAAADKRERIARTEHLAGRQGKRGR